MKRISNKKRKYFKKAASFLAVICCLAGSVIPGGSLPGTAQAAPRVVFENTEKAEPYLYVSKEAESALEQYPIPEEVLKETNFNFQLKIEKTDGTTSEFVQYTLFARQEEAGETAGTEGGDDLEVIIRNGIRYVEIPPERVADPYHTDRNGIFTLKAGQMARFDIGQRNRYEISEVEELMPAGFWLDRTEGGECAGTMWKSGKAVSFINKWKPENESGETTTLHVKKTVVSPGRYGSPDVLFAFQLEFFGLEDYQPYAGQSYTVVDASDSRTPVVIDGVTDQYGRARTDNAGIFYLKDGCIAVFQKVPNKTQYRVKEILTESDIPDIPDTLPILSVSRSSRMLQAAGQDESMREMMEASRLAQAEAAQQRIAEVVAKLQEGHWRLAGDSEQLQIKVTEAPLSRNTFEDINAAFVVSKTVEIPAGQDEGTAKNQMFTFLLTKEDGTVWSGAQYYLYGTEGTNGEKIIETTGPDGTFILKSGQAAVFFGTQTEDGEGFEGIAPGTIYGVQEKPETGFTQSMPEAVDTYTGMVVESGKVNLHPFVNEPMEPGSLTVTKEVVNVKGEAPAPGDKVVFTFKLTDAAGNAVQSNYTVTVGGVENSGSTDGNGYFTLKNGETAVFDKNTVVPGKTYKVQEVEDKLPPGYWFNRVEWKGRGGSNITEAESQIRGTDMAQNAESRIRETDMAQNAEGRTGETESDSLTARSLQVNNGGSEKLGLGISRPIKPVNPMNVRFVNDPIEISLTEYGADVTYYNNYVPDRTDIVLTKMDNTVADPVGNPGIGTKLAGAEFRLYRVEPAQDAGSGEGSATVETEVIKDKIYTTDADGTLRIENLSTGTYRLKETKAPDGYMIMEPIEIVIDRKGKPGGKAAVTINGRDVREDDTELIAPREQNPERLPCTAQFISSVTLKNDDSAMELFSLNQAGLNQAGTNQSYEYSTEDDQLILYAYDDFLYELPHSGGRGIYWYLIGGVLLMMAASLILYKDKLKYAGRLR